MSTPFPRTIIKKSSFGDLKLGRKDWEIESAQFDYTRDMVKQIVVQARVQAPADEEGRVHFERYTIGNMNDKEAEDPNTFAAEDNYGAQAFNELLDALEVDNTDIPDLEALLPQLSGALFSAKIRRRAGKDKSTGELTGKTYTNLSGYKKIGLLPAQHDQGEAVRVAPAVRTAVAPQRTVAAKANGAAKPVLRPQVAAAAKKPAPRFEIEEAE